MGIEKLHCYVDETGQDTKGALFLVAVVVAKQDRDELRHFLEAIERDTGKGAVKWRKAGRDARAAYLRRVLTAPQLQGRLFYSVARGTTAYRDKTLATIVASVEAARNTDRYKASVFIDGLPRSDVRVVAVGLRKMGIATEKVRGLRDEESALVRLADAVAGLVRAKVQGEEIAAELYELGQRNGTLREL